MGLLYRSVVYPTYHWFKRDGVNRAIRELERNQWLPYEELVELQRVKLCKLLTFASEFVPYYRRMFDERGIDASIWDRPDIFRSIPVLTKDIIRCEQDRLVSENLEGNGLIKNSTSGSTGDPIQFFTDFRSLPYRKAAGIRSHTVTGWRLGDRTASLWGAQVDEKRATAVRGWLHGLATGSLFLSSFDLSEQRMDDYITKMLKFKPVELFAYPGPLEQFAAHCASRRVKFPSLKGIVTSAETLWPHQRGLAESAFGVKVFDQYGCREVSQIATECAQHDGLHISIDRLVIEVVDESGQPCAPGKVGRILVTDLDNVGMPLIRYDIGDRGALAQVAPCDCGRGLPRLEKIEGRTLDIIQTADGRRIGGTFWTLLLRGRPGLRQFQVIQYSIDGVTIKFIPNAEFSDEVLSYFRTKIQEYCGAGFRVDFVEVDFIEVSVSGKQKLIVSLLNATGEPASQPQPHGENRGA